MNALDRSIVYLSDARNLGSLLGDEKVDLIVTGPPYWNEVVYSNHEEQLSKVVNYDAFLDALNGIFRECSRVLKDGAIFSLWMHDFFRKDASGNRRYVPLHSDIIQTMPEDLALKNIMIWNRYLNRDRGEMPSTPPIGTKFEYILIFQKSGKHANNHKLIERSLQKIFWDPIWEKKTSPSLLGSRLLYRAIFILLKPFRNIPRKFITSSPIISDKYIFEEYSTECPEDIAERLINDFSSPGDTVLDPFLGSGTTMKVAHSLNRRCIGVEINDGALPIIERRVGKDNFSVRK